MKLSKYLGAAQGVLGGIIWIRICGLVGEKWLLGVDFEVSETHAKSSVLLCFIL